MKRLIYYIQSKKFALVTPRHRRPLSMGEIMDIRAGIKESLNPKKCTSYPSVDAMFDDMESRI